MVIDFVEYAYKLIKILIGISYDMRYLSQNSLKFDILSSLLSYLKFVYIYIAHRVAYAFKLH